MMLRCLLRGWVAGVIGVAGLMTGWAQPAAHAPAFAAATDQAAGFKLLPGLRLDVWAAEPQLSNGVAFAFDGRGRAYIAETHRWNTSIFDITQRTNWLLADMAFRSVADRVEFLEAQFAAVDPELLTRDSELVRRVEDRDGDGKADHSEVFADGFNTPADGTAAGVLATAGRVYFANIPSLWSLEEKAGLADAPGRPKVERSALASGFGVHIGVSGHDLHGLIRGPDGRLYFSFGDRGVCLTNREGAVINLPDTGGVLRCEPDGSNLELFCFGLRNPQELAFDDEGNLWTVDNDTAGADPCRVLHLVDGGDYGWRTSYQHQEGFGSWVLEEFWRGGPGGLLPPAGTVSQGPSGLAFYPGTGFGDRLKGTFLHCDFPGGVWAYTVKARGASFEVDRKEKFLWNSWPTDVDFGPDGAAYVLDWVAGWGQPLKGRIYRITPSDALGAEEARRVAEVKALLAAGMAGRPEKELLGWLDHPDRRIRLEAQWELAGRGLKSLPALDEVAEEGRSRWQRLHALWAIGQIARAVSISTCPRELEVSVFRLLHLVEDRDRIVAAHAASVLADAASLEGKEAMTPLLSDPDLVVRRISGLALARMPMGRGIRTQPRAVDRVAGLVNKPWVNRFVADQFPRTTTWVGPLRAAEALLQGPTPDAFVMHAARQILQQGATMGAHYDQQLAQAATNANPAVRLAALQAHRRLVERALHQPVWPGFPHFRTNALAIGSRVVRFLSDPDPRIVREAVLAIHDTPIVSGFPALAALITRVDCPTNLMARSINAGFRLGTPQHAQMLASFAKRRDVPAWARARALEALGDWGKPAPLDRVIGLWRPLVSTPGDRAAGTSASDAPENPLLARARSAASGAVTGLTANPVLPDDLGRSVAFDQAMALKRNDQGARRAYLRVADEILNPHTPDEYGVVVPGGPSPAEVLVALLQAAVKLRTKEAAQPFFEKLEDTNTAPALRRVIVPALVALNAVQAPEAVQRALRDADPQVRSSAVPHLDRLEGDEAIRLLIELLPTAGKALTAASQGPAQAAVAALARRGSAAADAPLLALFDQLLEGRLDPRLEADVLAAARTRNLPAFTERLGRHEARLPRDEPLARWRSLLTGGDASRGGDVFRNNSQVQCLRCHKVGGDGGIVGPALDGIGKKRNREYLLEAILYPNRAYAEGFKPPEGGLSAMPEGLGELLTPLELRDVLEYLGGLK